MAEKRKWYKRWDLYVLVVVLLLYPFVDEIVPRVYFFFTDKDEKLAVSLDAMRVKIGLSPVFLNAQGFYKQNGRMPEDLDELESSNVWGRDDWGTMLEAHGLQIEPDPEDNNFLHVYAEGWEGPVAVIPPTGTFSFLGEMKAEMEAHGIAGPGVRSGTMDASE